MRLGIIGKGKIVKNLMQTVKDLPVEAMALLVRPEALEEGRAFAREYGMQAVFTDFDAFAAWKPDAVYVAVPNHLHYSYTKRALEAGLHVILEKPACSNAAQLEELIALAGSRGLYLMEAMTTWYLPVYAQLREALASIGRLRQVSLSYCQRSSRYDAFREGMVLPAFDPKASGGSLMDINIYNVAAAVGLFGAPEAAAYHANIQRGIDTSGTMLMDYPDFQVVAMGAKDCGPVAGGTFLGDEGTIRFEGPVSLISRFEVTNAQGTRTVSRELSHRMQPEFLAFDRILRGQDDALCAQMLQRSMTVMKLLDEGRRQADIRFPDDR